MPESQRQTANVGSEAASSRQGSVSSEAWARVCRRMRAELGEDVFAAWLKCLELESLTGKDACLSVPTKFLKSWIVSHYADKLLPMLAAEFPTIKRISLVIRSSARPALALAVPASSGSPPGRAAAALAPAPTASQAAAAPPVAKRPAFAQPEDETLAGSPLDSRLTFANFLVGASNQLAHTQALRIAHAAPGEALLYNPLYVHASVGLGKTHLLQAIAHAAASERRRVVYLTAERFMYGFVSALKAQTALAFKEKLRAIDILVIDDIQFLQGKSIQQEFCHTLNALIDSGRQIVTAADRPAGDLESLDERVRSRLAGGLSVEIGALDDELRVKILEARIAAAKAIHPGFDVPAPVVAYVASVIRTNGRDLDGAVNRLLAHASLNSTPISCPRAARQAWCARAWSQCSSPRCSRRAPCPKLDAASAAAIIRPSCMRCARSRASLRAIRPFQRRSSF